MSQFEKYTNHLYRPKCYSSPWLLNHVPVKLHETYHEKETWSTCPHDLALSPTVRNEQNALLFLLYISFSETHHSMPVGTIHSKPLGTTHSKPLGTIVKVNVWHEQSSTLGHNLIETIPQPVYDWWLDMISCAKGFTGDIYIYHLQNHWFHNQLWLPDISNWYIYRCGWNNSTFSSPPILGPCRCWRCWNCCWWWRRVLQLRLHRPWRTMISRWTTRPFLQTKKQNLVSNVAGYSLKTHLCFLTQGTHPVYCI